MKASILEIPHHRKYCLSCSESKIFWGFQSNQRNNNLVTSWTLKQQRADCWRKQTIYAKKTNSVYSLNWGLKFIYCSNNYFYSQLQFEWFFSYDNNQWTIIKNQWTMIMTTGEGGNYLGRVLFELTFVNCEMAEMKVSLFVTCSITSEAITQS